MRGEHLRRCPQWNQPRGHARRSHYATNLVSRLPPGAGPPTWRRDENNSGEADRWARPVPWTWPPASAWTAGSPTPPAARPTGLAHQRSQRPAFR